ncbi:MAG: class I SAM-dependent methyltransferase [Acidobacteriota bacterium]|nr:MAG: class I SAM-dependent methyltransferase [Acidobacteriota bacterium]
MPLKLQRTKKRSLIASLVYRAKLLPLARKGKLKLFLDLEWIFERLAHEASYEFYPSDEHPMRRQGVEHILQFIEPDHVVLDLGCSRGEITSKVAEKARRVVGVDHSEQAIQIARRFSKENLEYFVGDADEFLAKSDEPFDVLILSHILEHLDDPKGLLLHYKDRFRFIYIEVPDIEKTIFNKMRIELGSPLVYTDADHIWEFDRAEMKRMIAECALSIRNEDFRFGVQRYWCTTGK